ncbi:hypothetical protein MUN76_01310 [Leucobacter rhizosphaerae]|uniref:Uncharacterized protein n=1 Tax=Leucobacter rhizosphaerae TaxID=2932245 RepID=A0ABY4FWI6_9MICO|nr:hypothetical protein [Leucobacter rhizosphaerae]UOQ60652.1 hypothetical protein MUN76_01310 [Leucobacter rhizosphaerae]
MNRVIRERFGYCKNCFVESQSWGLLDNFLASSGTFRIASRVRRGDMVAGTLLPMAISSAQCAALAQMLHTSDDLDRWRLRAHRVEVPERGSELAIDDTVFPPMAISQLVRTSLVSAGEHLRLALDAIKAKQVYPSSHFTVLRGALVGSSQAVWILEAEDRQVRQERGLTVIAEMYEQMGKYYSFLEGTQLDEEDKAALNEQQAWLRQRRADVASMKRTKASLKLTEVIGSAADYAFLELKFREAVRRMWREMSADAHVLGWSLFQRTIFGQPDRRTGIGEGTSPGSPEHVAEPFMASYRMLRAGWSLFDRRCEAA